MKEERFNVKEINDSDMRVLCENIYDYKSGNGDVDKTTLLYKIFLANRDSYASFSYMIEDILSEASWRFDKVVKILFREKPYMYVR